MVKNQKPTAAEMMTVDVVTVAPGDCLQDVVQTLLKANVSNAPVVKVQSGKKMLVGLVSEKDCISAFGDQAFYTQPDTQIARIIKHHPICVKPQTDLFTLASIFMQHNFRHLPVIQDGELLGIVSRRDVLQCLLGDYHTQIRQGKAERVIPDYADIRITQFLIV